MINNEITTTKGMESAHKYMMGGVVQKYLRKTKIVDEKI